MGVRVIVGVRRARLEGVRLGVRRDVKVARHTVHQHHAAHDATLALGRTHLPKKERARAQRM
eukprot:551099-Prymnesium_polylepis.1